MVLIDHPQQDDVPQDDSRHPSRARGTPPRRMTPAPGGGTDAAVADPGRRRRARRPRRPATRTAPADHRRGGRRRAGPPDGPLLRRHDLLPVLRRPHGSIVLASAPAQIGDQAPIAPTVITGLAANGIPNVALNAYRVAAARMANSSPDCGIDWSLLAGIGRVETNHGRFRGATLNSDGTSSPRIMGPPLNGVQFAFIRDTDGGGVRRRQLLRPRRRADAVHPGHLARVRRRRRRHRHGRPVQHQRRGSRCGQLPLPRRRQPAHRRRAAPGRHGLQPLRQLRERGPGLARAYASGIPVADIPLVGNTTGSIPAPGAFGYSRYVGGPAAPGPAIGAGDMTPAYGPTTGASPDGGRRRHRGRSGGGRRRWHPAAEQHERRRLRGGALSTGVRPGARSRTPGPAPAGPAPAAPAAPAPAPVKLPRSRPRTRRPSRLRRPRRRRSHESPAGAGSWSHVHPARTPRPEAQPACPPASSRPEQAAAPPITIGGAAVCGARSVGRGQRGPPLRWMPVNTKFSVLDAPSKASPDALLGSAAVSLRWSVAPAAIAALKVSG